MIYCKQCLNKQQKLNYLEEEISTLKSKLRYQHRTAKEGFFGSSTPSAKIPVKLCHNSKITLIIFVFHSNSKVKFAKSQLLFSFFVSFLGVKNKGKNS